MLCIVMCAFPSSPASADEVGGTTASKVGEYYYFNPEEFGSNAFFNPAQIFIEGGAPGGRSLNRFEFSDATSDLYYELTNPIDAVNDYGAKKFFYYEFVPHLGAGQNWVPN